MNVYVWLSLSASIASVLLGLVVYSLNRKKLLNKLFLLAALSGCYWTFTEFMMWQASNVEIANFWSKMGFLWPFFVVLIFHFSLVYTESNWLKNKFTYLILYLPALVFALTDLTTELINETPVMTYWGYEDTSPTSLVYDLSSIWTAILPVLALVLCFLFYHRAKEDSKKKQSKFVTIGFAIPIFTYLVTNIVFPTFAIDFPNLGHIATLFFSIFVAYAILKYELFTFDAAIAAENIISTMPDSLILTDMKGKILKVNNRLVTFLGYSKDELTGKSVTALCVEEKLCESILKKLTEERKIRNCELTYRTKSKDMKNVLFSSSVVQSKTGRDIGFTCIVHDVTERKKMEERLMKAERLASIGELAGQVGHDLRNPLTSIKGSAYLLRTKADTLKDPERQKILEIIDSSVEDSNRIINSLVDYSMDLQLQISACRPVALLSSALQKAEIPKTIRVINNFLDDPEMLIDVSKIESVFTRIITNAIEAMPKKGTLEIRVAQKDASLEIAFTDSGIGIPKDVLPKIFSPLVTTKAKGMGLSLAICKRIIDAHNGEISVESNVGTGTTFTITLPIKPQTEFVFESDSMMIRKPILEKE